MRYGFKYALLIILIKIWNFKVLSPESRKIGFRKTNKLCLLCCSFRQQVFDPV
jgi:hypothetical protein